MKVLVFGTFDLLHPGHAFLLTEARRRACPPKPGGRRRGEVHVVVARDRNVERIKKIRAKQTEDERLEAVQKMFPEARVRLGDQQDFLAPLRSIRPGLILLGYDQKLPPGVSREDLPCPVERLPAFEPEKWKSSLRRKGRLQESQPSHPGIGTL